MFTWTGTKQSVNSHSHLSVGLDRCKGLSFSFMHLHFLKTSCSVPEIFLMIVALIKDDVVKYEPKQYRI